MQETNDQIGQFLTFTFKGNNLAVSGVVEAFNKDWILVRYYFDYRQDGYSLFRNKNVKYVHGSYEVTATKILKIKEVNCNKLVKLKIGALGNMLKNITRSFCLMQLYDKRGLTSRMTSYVRKEAVGYRFEEYDANANKMDHIILNEKDINHICFDNDYLNSLQLLMK